MQTSYLSHNWLELLASHCLEHLRADAAEMMAEVVGLSTRAFSSSSIAWGVGIHAIWPIPIHSYQCFVYLPLSLRLNRPQHKLCLRCNSPKNCVQPESKLDCLTVKLLEKNVFLIF